MGFVSAIKSFRWGYLLIALFLMIMGVLFMIYPTQSVNITAYIIGVSCIIFAIVYLVKVLSNRKRGFAFAISIIFSICTLICGIMAFIFPSFTASTYPMIIGLLIVIDGAFKLQTVINAKRYDLKMWWFLLIFCCIVILCGFLLIRIPYPEENSIPFIIFFGGSLFLTGVQNLLSLFYFGKISKKAIEHLEYEDKPYSVEDAVCADSYPVE